MKDSYRIVWFRDHVEVYLGDEFQFSADTIAEARRMIEHDVE